MLAENLQLVQQNIAQALAHRSEPKCTGTEVLLVAVTKNHPASAVTDILSLQVTDVGENRVQEARDKQKLLGHPGNWHLIGHLQTNKAKQAVELFDIIESVDSEHLLLALDKEAGKLGKRIDILLQINIAGETQKTGFAPADYAAILPNLDLFTHVRTRGIMVIAPQTDQVESVRPVFREGYRYFCALQKERPQIDYLSMGMTEDYQVAIEEGANVVRIGTALFGPRDYSKH
jgi:pyridoxal phosphate enzyme (YggS family)